MMRFEVGLETLDPRRAHRSALTIGGAYALSVGVTLAALAVFGFVKGRCTGARPWKSALQTTLIGGVAAAAAFAIARAVG